MRQPTILECLDAARPKVRIFEFRWPHIDPDHPGYGHLVPERIRGERIKDAFFRLPGIWAIDGFYSNVARLTFHAGPIDGKVYTDDDMRFLIAAAVHNNWGDPDNE